MALISCFSRCRTFAGSIARGKSVECLAGCSRCKHHSQPWASRRGHRHRLFVGVIRICLRSHGRRETIANLHSDLLSQIDGLWCVYVW